MSEKQKSQPAPNELIKKFESNCKNFINMSNIEKSDSMKLNYLTVLQKSAINYKIPQKTVVEIIFQNILFKKLDLIKSPNILLAFISYLRQTDELTFQKYFYELLYKFVSNYDENSIYFKNYLILFSLEIFFETVNNCEDNTEDIEIRKKYFSQIIYTDIKEFKEQFFKYIINSKIKLIDNKIKFDFIKNFIEIIIVKNKYQIGVLLLKLIKEEIKENNYPNELIELIINIENKSGFNILLKSKKNINDDFLTFLQLILQNTSKDFIIDKNNESVLDFFFVNVLNILCIKKEFNINIIKYCFDYYKNNKTKILKKIFPSVIYYLSSYAYTSNQISFLFNDLGLNDAEIINPIFGRIIYKNPISFKKNNFVKNNFKINLDNIKIIIDNKDNGNDNNEKDLNIKSILYHSLFINKDESNIYLLIYLTTYNYIIDASFTLKENNYILNFISLNKSLKLISELPLEKISDTFSELFLQFLLDYFSVIFEFCLSLDNIIDNLNIILKTFKSFFDIFKKLANKEDKQLGIIFPSLINLLGKNIKIELTEPILDYFIETFARKTRQCDIFFKTIKSILINSDKINFDNKFFLVDKLINLVIESNEHKSFESLFSLSNELLKGNDTFNQNLSQYIINKYSKYYTGALSSLLENHIIAKFDENFIQNKFSIEKITDDNYNTLNTLNNIYLQDKTDNLNEIVDKLFRDDYKTIINIFNELFEFMDKDENNKNIFNFNSNENLIEKYSDMKNNLNKITNFFSFIKLDYEKNNEFFKTNKKLIQIYGTTYYLSHLLTQYLSIKISKEKEIDNEEEKKKETDKLMIIFNYIHEKVILNKDIKNNIFKAFFINSILFERNILDFYFVRHTNILVNEEIQQKQLDYSQLRILSSNLNKIKSNKIIDLLKSFPLNIILIHELIFALFSYDSDSIINPHKVNLYNKHSKQYHIIKNLNGNKLITKIKEMNTKEEKNEINNNKIDDLTLQINSTFSKIFFDFISNLSKKENLELNQIYYLFCLDYDIFYLYYNSLCDFYDYEYAILEFYSLIRNEGCYSVYKEKFLKFLNDFNFIENVLVFNIRIFSENLTFDKLISKQDENHSEKMTNLLCDIITYILNNLLKYNSYQTYAENCIQNIINNIFKFTKDLIILSNKANNSKEKINPELNYLKNLINYIFEIFSTESNNFTNKKLPKKSELSVNIKLIKNINKIIDEKYNSKNPKIKDKIDNKDLFNFLQIQEDENSNKNKNIKDLYKFLEDDIIISDYNNNPKRFPFPIEHLMDKYGFNKQIKEN